MGKKGEMQHRVPQLRDPAPSARVDRAQKRQLFSCIISTPPFETKLTVNHLHDAARAAQPFGQHEATGYQVAGGCAVRLRLVGLGGAARRVQEVATRVPRVYRAGALVVRRAVERVFVKAFLGDDAIFSVF